MQKINEMNEMKQSKENRIIAYLKQNNLDAMLVSRPVNVKYVSGYSSDDAYLLLTQTGKMFITDPRYTELAQMECPSYELIEWRDHYGSVPKAVAGLAQREKLQRIAYESTHLTVDLYLKIKELLQAELIPANDIIEELRMQKSEVEIAYAKAACDISVRAFERILADIRPGVTEKELAASLSRYMVLEGADTMPYGNILISGARTSLLHGIPSEKSLEYGDLVLMDYGCQFHGYMSDMTRTVVVGKATEKQKEVYRLEQQMVADVENYLKDGVSAKNVYMVSRKAIENTDYLPYHYTGIGHGVGLFVHEQPFLGPKSDAFIRKNTIMTVEPGIYIPGWGGVRIEDTVLVTETGIVNLTPASKELIEL